jgi:uncharacterized membrane protein YccF (DUF307 family)
MTDESQKSPVEASQAAVAASQAASAPPPAVPVVAPPVPAAQPPASQTNTTNVNVVVQPRSSGPGFLIRAVWFVFIGWWLSGIVTTIAYFVCITIIGMPIGFAMFNRLPYVLTLRSRSERYVTEVRDGVTFIRGGTVPQLPMVARVVWFLLIGWWLGAVYSFVAWLLCVIVITLPLGLWMYNRIGAVMTLLRY